MIKVVAFLHDLKREVVQPSQRVIAEKLDLEIKERVVPVLQSAAIN